MGKSTKDWRKLKSTRVEEALAKEGQRNKIREQVQEDLGASRAHSDLVKRALDHKDGEPIVVPPKIGGKTKLPESGGKNAATKHRGKKGKKTNRAGKQPALEKTAASVDEINVENEEIANNKHNGSFSVFKLDAEGQANETENLSRRAKRIVAAYKKKEGILVYVKKNAKKIKKVRAALLSQHNGRTASENSKKIIKSDNPLDLWGDEEIAPDLTKNNKKNSKKPTISPNSPHHIVPAVKLPHPGQSYNPAETDRIASLHWSAVPDLKEVYERIRTREEGLPLTTMLRKKLPVEAVEAMDDVTKQRAAHFLTCFPLSIRVSNCGEVSLPADDAEARRWELERGGECEQIVNSEKKNNEKNTENSEQKNGEKQNREKKISKDEESTQDNTSDISSEEEEEEMPENATQRKVMWNPKTPAKKASELKEKLRQNLLKQKKQTKMLHHEITTIGSIVRDIKKSEAQKKAKKVLQQDKERLVNAAALKGCLIRPPRIGKSRFAELKEPVVLEGVGGGLREAPFGAALFGAAPAALAERQQSILRRHCLPPRTPPNKHVLKSRFWRIKTSKRIKGGLKSVRPAFA